MIAALALTTLLALTDAPNDAVGAGELSPPTSPVYRSAAAFDLVEVEALEENGRLAVAVELGALPDPFGLPLGFSLPVIDVYVDTGEGGAESPLAGLGLRLAEEARWRYAVRLTGDAATGYAAVDAELREVPLEVELDGDRILVRTPFPVERVEGVAAAVGVYDPFGPTPWRPVEPDSSPWAFSGALAAPVVDALAADAAAQRRALAGGTLPLVRAPRRLADGRLWLALAVIGLGVALYGAALRFGLGGALERAARAGRGRVEAWSRRGEPRPEEDAGSPRPADDRLAPPATGAAARGREAREPPLVAWDPATARSWTGTRDEELDFGPPAEPTDGASDGATADAADDAPAALSAEEPGGGPEGEPAPDDEAGLEPRDPDETAAPGDDEDESAVEGDGEGDGETEEAGAATREERSARDG